MVKAFRPFCRSFCRIFTRKVRKEIWGYAADEVLSTDDMIAETYKGIRPALVIPLVLIIWKTNYLEITKC
jgi:5-methyltetrahydrofolate--homocysteine methyltransferase